jgi:hypothetical protein
VSGFRASLGFEEEPQSPDTVRGGDSSLFSLPSESAAGDATPHTSNVSLTTTITSAVSFDKHSRHMGYPLQKVDMRRALEAVSTLFDRLSAACLKLVGVKSTKSEASVKAVEEIKRVYLLLLTLSVEDLKALIDSFELDLMPMQITRLVSEDRCDSALLATDNSAFLSQPQPFVRSSGSIAQLLITQTMGLPIESLKVNFVEDSDEGSEMFLLSPNTEDMNSIVESAHTGTVDDLRRTVGSFNDEEEVEEERDGPPPHVPAPRAVAVAKKKKTRRSIWKRRQPRAWQQMAE